MTLCVVCYCICLGGGILGSHRLVTVIIAKSDYPNGKLSFRHPIRRELINPEILVVIPVTVERSDGLLGRQMVSLQFTHIH